MLHTLCTALLYRCENLILCLIASVEILQDEGFSYVSMVLALFDVDGI